MKKQLSLRFIHFLAVICISAGFFSCDKRDVSPESEMAIQTGPATYLKLGGGISTFRVIFNDLGSEPLEEYGIVYSFDENLIDRYPDLKDKKAVFDLPARLYANEKTVNIGFPVGAKLIGIRAYAKLTSGKVKYAEPIITYF